MIAEPMESQCIEVSAFHGLLMDMGEHVSPLLATLPTTFSYAHMVRQVCVRTRPEKSNKRGGASRSVT